ncbi:hypothetical protein Fot_37884 [Forsythia ovata]|uniref:Uncharacterized protein n=1 Tax=Forsythia ovata TaxID=205694 RepID=A0ABD1S086_9LAMI
MDNPHIPSAPEATTVVPSTSILTRPVPLSESARQSVKRKAGAESGEEASWTSTSLPLGKCEYINIGSRQDKLDPTVLGKLPPVVVIAATSVHKYWTSIFGKAAYTAEVTELVKLAEMLTKCIPSLERTKMSKRCGPKTNIFGRELAFSEDARTRATYDVTKAQTIQKVCVDARKKAESQLKSCQNMIQAKDKKLTKALSELAKAKGLLAKLGVPGYAEP